MIIRQKKLKDCEEWVDININSWNENLKGIVSDKLLKFMIDDRDSRIKKDISNFKQDNFNYVLEEDSEVIGILKLKKCSRNNYEDYAEVQVLYLKTKEKGKGYGKLLINKAFEVFRSLGYNKVIIGCLENNPSNEFYKHLGGNFIGQEPWNVLDEHYIENVYEFNI